MRAIAGFWHPLEVSDHLNYMRSFGMGRSIQSLCMLPVNLLFRNDALQESIGQLLIGMLAAFFVKKWTRLIGLCGVILIAYLLAWFYNFQILRYLFPVFPILSLLAGWTLQQACDQFKLRKQWFWRFSIIAILFLGCFNCPKTINNNGPLPITNNQQLEYLAKRIPTFLAISFLDKLEQSHKAVYALYDEGSVFYYKNKVIGDCYGFATYDRILPCLDKPGILHKVLADYGVQYFLIHRKPGLQISQALLQSDLFKLLYSDQKAYVFELL
jgi:hypothetical protein